ncbi:hypothetical protein GUJ93_ZPchr0008g11775 [Zizania palustris]|uniref:Uncharacterized protein n=1 Tax=Zizania palustris TaxID=103762 RepID=A0A8J5VFP5_ZIZPA|nr:hypothetical protein GUJ93_ZPchr0008g11775 [Zizania palustris]
MQSAAASAVSPPEPGRASGSGASARMAARSTAAAIGASDGSVDQTAGDEFGAERISRRGLEIRLHQWHVEREDGCTLAGAVGDREE